MLTIEEARTRVQRGAAHLDTVRPEWFNQIDVGILDLALCWNCLLGQLYGEFNDGVRRIGLDYPSIGCWWASHHNTVHQGFVLPEPAMPDDYETLQDAWLEVITARRLKATRANLSMRRLMLWSRIYWRRLFSRPVKVSAAWIAEDKRRSLAVGYEGVSFKGQYHNKLRDSARWTERRRG